MRSAGWGLLFLIGLATPAVGQSTPSNTPPMGGCETCYNVYNHMYFITGHTFDIGYPGAEEPGLIYVDCVSAAYWWVDNYCHTEQMTGECAYAHPYTCELDSRVAQTTVAQALGLDGWADEIVLLAGGHTDANGHSVAGCDKTSPVRISRATGVTHIAPGLSVAPPAADNP